jgi:transposase
MNAQVWAEIKRLCLREGLSQRRVAQMMKLDKKTVRRALRMEEYKARKTSSCRRPSKLAPYKKDIAELIEEYPGISGQRIYEELQKRGYQGKITILQDYLKEIRDSQKEAFLRIETLPGEQAQADWADCGSIKIGEHTRRLSCFVMVLSYSRLMYLEFTLSQRLEDFMRCHVNAFKFFGGVPAKILYDNLKSVVLVRLGSQIRFNPKFAAFSGHYLFKPIPCNPRRANEKGRVENGIKYVKRNFLMGRTFVSFSDLKSQSVKWRDNTANVRMHGTTRQRPVDLHEIEENKLMSLPEKDYDTSIVAPVKATRDCRVKFDANTYSVPFEYAGRGLTVKANPDQVMIYSDIKLLAAHPRSYEKYLAIENPNHYQGLLVMKKRARTYKIRDILAALGEGTDAYLKGMVNAELNLNHHIRKILEMVDIYGKTEVLGAINRALKYDAFGCDYVKNIILQQRAKRGSKKIINPISIVGNKEFANASVEERDLDIYDNLFVEDEED